jgi:hypothetical protein
MYYHRHRLYRSQNIAASWSPFSSCFFLSSPSSRALLLSGSPIDKSEQAAQLFFTLGIIGVHHPRLVSYVAHAREYRLTGMRDVLAYCRAIVHGTTEKAYRKHTKGGMVVTLAPSVVLFDGDTGCGGEADDERNAFYEVQGVSDRATC